MIYLTVKYAFNAFHKMWNPALPAHENIDAFGKCANPAGHGHGYRLEITLEAKTTKKNPFVLSRREIERIKNDVLAPGLDCRDLNEVFGEGFLSSGENIAKAVWEMYERELKGNVSLAAVKVIETNKNTFTYCGGKACGPVTKVF